MAVRSAERILVRRLLQRPDGGHPAPARRRRRDVLHLRGPRHRLAAQRWRCVLARRR
eukprot:SM015320S01366  [mRNA]  locus=s15320:127:294:+ [translate_table: standard]